MEEVVGVGFKVSPAWAERTILKPRGGPGFFLGVKAQVMFLLSQLPQVGLPTQVMCLLLQKSHAPNSSVVVAVVVAEVCFLLFVVFLVGEVEGD